MRLRTVRFSGMPVSPQNLEAYNAEWQTSYDAILAEHGQDMLTVHAKLQELETTLQNKYTQIESNGLPKSKKGWLTLLDQFDAPIMLAKSSENADELVMVIMDQPLG